MNTEVATKFKAQTLGLHMVDLHFNPHLLILLLLFGYNNYQNSYPGNQSQASTI